jgi:hypothetical protein
MTEETTQETTQEVTTETPANNGINISIEQILAAVIKTVGDTNVSLDDLVANYSQKTISVNQLEDKSVTFSLVDAPQVETTESQDEAAE